MAYLRKKVIYIKGKSNAKGLAGMILYKSFGEHGLMNNSKADLKILVFEAGV